jgi:hypothetical protein
MRATSRNWTVSEVCSWAIERKYSTGTVKSLADNDIDGEIMLTLTSQDLRVEVGVKSLKERRRLTSDINALKGLDFVHQQLEHNEEYSTLKQAVANETSSGVPTETLIRNMQTDAVRNFEARVNDHKLAAETQAAFNLLALLEEEDEAIARAVNNANDRTAFSRLQTITSESNMVDEVSKLTKVGYEERKHESGENKSYVDSEICCNNVVENVSTDMSALPHLPIAKFAGAETVKCVVCQKSLTGNDASNFNSLQSMCGHCYCASCLRDWFQSALTDSTLLPLRCCQQPLPEASIHEVALKVLGKAQAVELKHTTREKLCTHKMYCPTPTCSAFIDLDWAEMVLDMDLTFDCPSALCSTRICYQCQTFKHDRTLACSDNQTILEQQDGAVATGLRSRGFQRCEQCRMFVELETGCNHMTCRCHHEFCYVCGEKWKNCSCPLFDDTLLAAEQERLVAPHVRGVARAHEVERRVREAREAILLEEDCSHNTMRRNDAFGDRRNKPRCKSCSRRLNLFGYDCDSCPWRLCIGCNLHRR